MAVNLERELRKAQRNLREAHDEITRLEAENERLREALENSYCELCGCAECLEREALQDSNQ